MQSPTGQANFPGAEQVRDPVPGMIQEPWKAWALTIVTLGVYGLFHHYRLNRELDDFGVEVDPVKSALAYFPGAVLVVPYLITLYRTGQRIAIAQETNRLRPTARGWISPLAGLFVFLSVPYHQSELNMVWRAEAEPVTGDAPPG